MTLNLSNLHSHTTFSDGADSVEEMVLAAIHKNFISFGISDHSFIPRFSSSMRPEATLQYAQTIRDVADRYRNQIEVYCGIEWDALTDPALYQGLGVFDYIIGSVHEVPHKGDFFGVDDTTTELEKALNGPFPRVEDLVKRYYDQVVEMTQRMEPDILGHLDLVKKFNGDNRYFDENSGWYQDLLDGVVFAISKADVIVEVNTGGIARGYRTDCYPGDILLSKLNGRGVPIMINSDCHSRKKIDAYYAEAALACQAAGYQTRKILKGGEYIDVPL